MKTITGEEFRLELPQGARIALAFSGGRDSAVLFDMLKSAGADFFAVHVEHGIRGADSLSDAKFAEEFSASRGVECRVFGVDAPGCAKAEGLTLEQAARKLRYGVFESLLASGECDLVALAHHADDQTETVLMRILRGTGIRGLKGMSARTGKYIRPLLFVSRDEINAYAEERDIPFTEDATNADESYTRNFLRAELARIKERFPSVNRAVARLAAHAAEADAFIDARTPVPTVTEGEVRLPVSAFGEPLTAKRAVMRACAALGAEQDVEDKHYAAVIALASMERGKRIELTHGVTAHAEGEEIVFAKRASAQRECEEVALPDDLSAAEFRAHGTVITPAEREQAVPGRGALFADADKLPRGAVLRNRREGDVITKFGGGTKSLGDFLTDRKVPLRKRDALTVCALGKEVFFVVGVEISDKIKLTDATEHIIKITEDKDVR